MALARRAVETGLVHHSDRGSQYASIDYTDLLKENGIDIIMSRKATQSEQLAREPDLTPKSFGVDPAFDRAMILLECCLFKYGRGASNIGDSAPLPS